jgi:hypothetical protein
VAHYHEEGRIEVREWISARCALVRVALTTGLITAVVVMAPTTAHADTYKKYFPKCKGTVDCLNRATDMAFYNNMLISMGCSVTGKSTSSGGHWIIGRC